MSLRRLRARLLPRRSRLVRRRTPPRRVVLTSDCAQSICRELRASANRRHEGIVYLIGIVSPMTTLAIEALRPDARTTSGSVDVAALALAPVIRRAAVSGLQVVGQVHTHPGIAYHSDGDLVGMHIRFPGYASIVIPNYGSLLPDIAGHHALVWTEDGFEQPSSVVVLQRGSP